MSICAMNCPKAITPKTKYLRAFGIAAGSMTLFGGAVVSFMAFAC
jgi:hypothetical protein